MADYSKAIAEKRLSITRETELLQSFVRINVNDENQEQGVDEPSAEHHQPKPDEEGESKVKQTPISPDTTRRLSQQLSQDIKKRGKRRRKKFGPRQQEIYCDKDRAAAVNLGSKDIKQSLKMKRKQDRSQALQIPEEAEPSTFLALGNYEMCRGDLKIAIDFISKALELNPVEKNALVARSKCYILMGQPENALKDAETALQIDKHFMKAIYQKAESLYYLGDFEHSLMYYHRGLHIRPDHEGFKLGVHKAQKAIENAIGSSFSQLIQSRAVSSNNISVKSETSIDSNPETKTQTNWCLQIAIFFIRSNWSRFYYVSRLKIIKSKKKTKLKSLIKWNKYYLTSDPTPKTSNRTTPFRSNRTLKKSRLLRELGPDKEYLDNLMHNPNIKCKYKENDSTVEKCILDTVEYLNARQEFWRQQLPQSLK